MDGDQNQLNLDLLAQRVKQQGLMLQHLRKQVKQQDDQVKQQSLKVFNLKFRVFQSQRKKHPIARKKCYRGWLIKLIPQGCHWTVAYSTPGNEVFIDEKNYETSVEALAAAKGVVDRNITGWALLDFLFELYEDQKINTEQYSQLMNSLVEDCF
ncbi:hypothetical protein AVDCRST_MAG81-1932 [uncultured Synechococcales cyanobacterium]|uniref:Uncharacterized protein n=1 Tax=uncultured Synechococcales cyanobacterium TaxID=1936017 RepID=A0A6J4UJU6_9CYAN|nr:hypothetical protein AVDCRST_MAG81-1932 [uncultured Synechococcales cyanobacterium]